MPFNILFLHAQKYYCRIYHLTTVQNILLARYQCQYATMLYKSLISLYRSLEECLASHGLSPNVASLRHDLEKVTAKLNSSQTCEVHLKAEVIRLRDKWDVLKRLLTNDNMQQQQLTIESLFWSKILELCFVLSGWRAWESIKQRWAEENMSGNRWRRNMLAVRLKSNVYAQQAICFFTV